MKKFVAIAALASLSAVGAYGTQTCASGETIFPSATLTQGSTTSSAFSCQLGSYVFSNFEFVANIVPTADAALPFGMALSVSTGGSTLDFALTEAAGEDIRLYFTVSPGILGMSMTVAGTGSNISEYICSSAIYPATVCPSGTQLANFNVTSGNSGDSGTISVVGTDYIFKDIQAGQGLSDFTQTIIPEPMTLSLMGAGLLGLGIFGRRRFKK